MEKVAFLGASRGLGRAVVTEWMKRFPETKALGVSRKISQFNDPIEAQSIDFSKAEILPELVDLLSAGEYQRCFYFAGGGPWGRFGEKKWTDHQWAWQVNFLTPAFLIYRFLHKETLNGLQQLVVVGSAIADDLADPKGASYASSKHAMRGLVETVAVESPEKDLRLFRPGYMDTDMLPKNAKPREIPEQILDPAQVAEKFVEWVMSPNAEKILTLRRLE